MKHVFLMILSLIVFASVSASGIRADDTPEAGWKVHPIWSGERCLSAVAADFTKDGRLDAATCAYGSRLCVWYENTGRGEFVRHVVGTDQEAYDIRVVDLDSDGDNDFLVAGRASDNVVWYENPGK